MDHNFSPSIPGRPTPIDLLARKRFRDALEENQPIKSAFHGLIKALKTRCDGIGGLCTEKCAKSNNYDYEATALAETIGTYLSEDQGLSASNAR